MSKLLDRIIKTSIYLLVFLLPLFFLPFSFEAFEFNKQYLLFFLVSIASFSWLAKMVLVDKEIRIKKNPLNIPILIFLLIAILGTIFSVDRASSLLGFYGKYSDSLIGLISLVVMYFLIVNNAGIESGAQNQKTKIDGEKSNKEEDSGQILSVQGLLKAFLWSIFFIILFSYLSIFGVWSSLKWLPVVMLQNIFNPIAGSLEGLAIFLAVVTIFLTGLLMTNLKFLNFKLQKFIVPLLLFLSLALLLIIDFNRAWILLSITLILCLVIALAKRIFRDDINKLLLPIFLIIISATFFFINTSGLQSLIFKTQFAQEQVLSQKYSFDVAFKAATENIKSALIGSGTGTFYYDFTKFKPREFNQTPLWQIRFDRSGSNFSEILATMGFLGILSYLLLVIFFLIIGYLFIRQNRDALPLIMTFLALVVGQFVYYQNTTMAFCFWLFLALSAVVLQKSANDKVFSLKNFPEMALVFSVLLMALGFGILSMYFFGAKFYWADVNYQNSFAENKIEKLEAATVLNPYQPVYRVALSRFYLDKFVTEAQKSTEEIDQNALSVYAFQAINYTKGGQVGNVYIKGATELAPNNVMCWETLGIVYRQLQGLVEGSSDWAIKSFERAMSLEPTNPVLLTEIGKIYMNTGDVQKAREEFDKAKELKSDYADAFLQEASTYEKEGNLKEAIKQIEVLAASYPTSPEIILELGRLYFNDNQTDKAIAQFQGAINLEPNYSNAHYSLGIAYEKNGEISKAISEIEKVLALNPGNADIQKKLEELKSPKE